MDVLVQYFALGGNVSGLLNAEVPGESRLRVQWKL